MSKENLEIERKFLLKKVPLFKEGEVEEFYIHQVYVEIDGRVTRFRATENLTKTEDVTYVQCNKRLISEGVFEEIEKSITQELFKDMLKKEHSYITKIRRVYECDGLKWEVDEYSDIALVTLEVELDDINQEIAIPEIIKKEIIIEITGQREFSNQSLSNGVLSA